MTVRVLALFFVVLFALDTGLGAVLEHFHPTTPPPAAPSSSYRVASPIYHHDLRPNVRAVAAWGPYRYALCTNSLGFRDRAPREIPLASSGRRVVLIGDSMTEGVGLPYELTFAGRIATRLERNGCEVLNAAVVSYSPSIYERKVRYLLEDRGLVFDELVVLLDVSDIEDEALYYTIDSEGNVVDRPGAPWNGVMRHMDPARERPWWSWSLSGRTLHAVKNVVYGSGGWLLPIGKDPGEAVRRLASTDRGDWTVDDAAFERFGRTGLEGCREAMDRLRDLLTRHGIELTLVVYPWPAQVLACDRDSRQVRFWGDWANDHGVPFVDLFPLFVLEEDPWVTVRAYYLPWDVHLNELGHRRVGEAMLPILKAHAHASSGGPGAGRPATPDAEGAAGEP